MPSVFLLIVSVIGIALLQRFGRKYGQLWKLAAFFFVIGVVRFGFHYWLMAAGVHENKELVVLGLAYRDAYDQALPMLLVFLFSYAIGFAANAAQKPRLIVPSVYRRKRYNRKLLFMAFFLGLMFTLVFFVLNGGGFSTIISGDFRRYEIIKNTGYFFYIGLVSIPSGAILITDYFAKNRARYAFAVAISYMMVFSILGGRVRALILLALWAVQYWKSLYEHSKLKKNRRSIMVLISMALFSLVIFLILGSYRSGVGLSMDLVAGFRFGEKLLGSFYSEIGLYQSLVSISRYPGELMWTGAWTNVIYPFNHMLGLGSRSGGVFAVQMGLDDFSSGRAWGFHASIIGDSFLAFGLPSVAIFSFLVGYLMSESMYRLRNGKISDALFLLVFLAFVRVTYESMDKIPEIYITLTMYILLERFTRKKDSHISPP